MTIENIQKKRFLDTIYKIYYSLGSEPSINEISTIYGRYFSRFKPGQPIPAPYQDLSASAVIDHEKLNRILAHTTFNIDVLYDSFYEEIEELYATISAFKFRMDNLRSRRAELEKTVDDHLFAINNIIDKLPITVEIIITIVCIILTYSISNSILKADDNICIVIVKALYKHPQNTPVPHKVIIVAIIDAKGHLPMQL
jgi:hypothetical protein